MTTENHWVCVYTLSVFCGRAGSFSPKCPHHWNTCIMPKTQDMTPRPATLHRVSGSTSRSPCIFWLSFEVFRFHPMVVDYTEPDSTAVKGSLSEHLFHDKCWVKPGSGHTFVFTRGNCNIPTWRPSLRESATTGWPKINIMLCVGRLTFRRFSEPALDKRGWKRILEQGSPSYLQTLYILWSSSDWKIVKYEVKPHYSLWTLGPLSKRSDAFTLHGNTTDMLPTLCTFFRADLLWYAQMPWTIVCIMLKVKASRSVTSQVLGVGYMEK